MWQITPDGHLALVTAGTSDGHVDAMPIYDLTVTPWRVIDWVVVGDGPEGLTISPTGSWRCRAHQWQRRCQECLYYHQGALAVLPLRAKR